MPWPRRLRARCAWNALADVRSTPRRAGARGFTLLEMVLVMAVLSILAAAAVLNLTGWRYREDLDEGATRFEAMLRMARADAANNGRRIRLSFAPETGEIRVLWEPDPITQPNQFVEYTTSSWAGQAPGDLVRVTRCELTGPSAYRTLVMDELKTDKSSDTILEDVTFYPDGSSDSAVIEMASLHDESDTRRAIIELDGLNTTVTTRILTSLELQEMQQGK